MVILIMIDSVLTGCILSFTIGLTINIYYNSQWYKVVF